MTIYFGNFNIGLHNILYIYVKFHVNRMLFTIQSTKVFFMHNHRCQNLKFKHLIDNITIDFFFLLKILQA